jgi:hypothetical protein
MEENEKFGEKPPRIRRGRVGSVDLYEITDSELDTLERGSPSSTFLNFAIGLLSVASSFLIALITSTFSSDRVFTVFVVITAVGFIAGLVLLRLWWVSRESIGPIIARIRSRLKDGREDGGGETEAQKNGSKG